MNAKKPIHAIATGCAAALLTLSFASPVHAQDTFRTETTRPNPTLLRTGVVVLGLSYVPAFVVAATNPRPDDDYLYIPVVGPWFDLTHREACVNCEKESLNKALLVTDGIFQGIGALELVGSFLFMETTVRTTAGRPAKDVATKPAIPLTITPGTVSGGYGVVASGQF